ncbi:hypothetical protein SAMN06265365_103268 [Tistlia consotensis]|uniref:PAS domain-containing protein n=1 Tax=Tistlia consotensis USBA 355 TaxID=560819 RepID=A0A1Y6C9B9_9PROT|nr:hypothetical protein [Tistlia consotensis]SMF43093.1 hypothetical protein SAMN05428998_11530 [Tistlia consotensis USBA 355]SNR42207.1 hypothetical protein SAMN06265365_103268 [Tistlia consotensis]
MAPADASGKFEARRALGTLPEAESWALARRLAEGEPGCCDALMARLGSPPPLMVWNPQPEDLESEVLGHLVRWWHGATAGGPPPPEAVAPLVLRPALGAISLLHVIDDGRDFEMRLHGSQISQTLGMDMTGMRLGEMAVPFMAFLIVTYRAQLLRPEPLLLRYTPAMQYFLSAWWRIGLPLMRDGKVVRLLIGMERAPRQDER